MVYQRNYANHVQKGEEYSKIPFFVAGITFFAGIVDRRILWKRVCGSQQVGGITFVESAPYAVYGEAKKSEPRQCRMWSAVSFRWGWSTSLLPRIARLHYSAFHNFKKLEQFINAGLGLVFQKICLKYITVLPLKENGV